MVDIRNNHVFVFHAHQELLIYYIVRSEHVQELIDGRVSREIISPSNTSD